MKLLLVSITLFCITYGYAQNPDPNLYQTWYLDYIQLSDLSNEYEISEIDPTIAPFLVIAEDLSFTGEGACNSMMGNFSNPNANNIEVSNYSNTTDDCGVPIHTSVEDDYFDFMSSMFWYEINTDDDGMILTLNTALFGTAIFRNYLLDTPDFKLEKIKIYPNPSSSKIAISSSKATVRQVEMINVYGDIVKVINENFDSIEVEDLSTGIYFVRVYSENGVQNKKFLKK